MAHSSESAGMKMLGLLTGVVFGALLQRGRLGQPDAIVGQIRFKNWRVIKTMASAIVVGGAGINFLVKKGLVKNKVKPLKVGGVVGGALLFGSGMALLGYCPGTSLVAVGEGRRDALAGALGMLAGAGLYIALYPKLKPLIEAGGNYGKITLRSSTPAQSFLIDQEFEARPKEDSDPVALPLS